MTLGPGGRWASPLTGGVLWGGGGGSGDPRDGCPRGQSVNPACLKGLEYLVWGVSDTDPRICACEADWSGGRALTGQGRGSLRAAGASIYGLASQYTLTTKFGHAGTL